VKAALRASLLLLSMGAIITALLFIWIGWRGISAKAQPGRIETFVARTMRHLAIPRAARNARNPVTRTSDVVAEGMAHFADHCAVCHGNDGSGDTEMGRGLYPKPPDMRLAATQSLSDGELYYIIENGVRLTGMPAAWSTGHAEDEESTWRLVHFIRELPRLTPEKIEEMKLLNPRSPAEIRQELEEEAFLKGGKEAPAPQPPPHHHKGGHK
jgi:mono/diheme cytochrome c family protein